MCDEKKEMTGVKCSFGFEYNTNCKNKIKRTRFLMWKNIQELRTSKHQSWE